MADDAKKTVKIDPAKCIKCGTCVAMYPDVFEFSEDGSTVRVKKDVTLDDKNPDDVVSVCPSAAISPE